MYLLKGTFFIELFIIILEGYLEALITAVLADQGIEEQKLGQVLIDAIVFMMLVVTPLAFIYHIIYHNDIY